jgi:hypothetical protein
LRSEVFSFQRIWIPRWVRRVCWIQKTRD